MRGWPWGLILIIVAGGCEEPHHTVQSIIDRQSTALRKLPEEDRARLITTDASENEPAEEKVLPPGTLELEQAREMALRDNPDIHASQARLEAALARIAEARSFYFPQIELVQSNNRTLQTPNRLSRFNAPLATPLPSPQVADPSSPLVDLFNALSGQLLQSQRQQELSSADTNSFSDHSTALRSTWTLFDGFVREARLLSAKYTSRASAMALADTQRLLIQAVDTAYYQAQLGREQIRIAKADEEFSQKQLADAQRRFEAKKITKAGVLNFEVRVRAAQANLVAAQGLEDTGKILLAQLLALPEADFPEQCRLSPLAEETTEDLTSPEVDWWIVRAMDSRPDLAGAQHILKARAENILIAKGQFSPEIAMQGSWGYERFSNMAYSKSDQSSAIGVEMHVPLTTGGFRTAQLRRARAEWYEARSNLRSKELEVAADVRLAIIDLRNAQEQVRLEKTNLGSASENRGIVETEYAAGKASLVRLNQAQNDYLQTDVRFARARIRLRQSWSDLYAAAAAYGNPQSEE